MMEFPNNSMSGPEKPQIPPPPQPPRQMTEEEKLDEFFDPKNLPPRPEKAPPETTAQPPAEEMVDPATAAIESEASFAGLLDDESSQQTSTAPAEEGLDRAVAAVDAEDSFAGMAEEDSEDQPEKPPKGSEQEYEMIDFDDDESEKKEKEFTPNLAYEYIKQAGQESEIKIFPVLLAYQNSPEKDWQKFFTQYSQDSGLSAEKLQAQEELLKEQVFQQVSPKDRPAFLDTVTERYKLEVNSLIYDSLERFRSGQSVPDDLIKLIPEGKDLSEVLGLIDGLGVEDDKKDLVSFLGEYRTSLSKYPLNTDEDVKSFTKDLMDKGYRPEHIEIGLILDTIGNKFNQDVVSEVMDRTKKIKEISIYADVLADEQYGVIYSNVNDEIIERVMNRYENIKDLQDLLIMGEKQIIDKTDLNIEETPELRVKINKIIDDELSDINAQLSELNAKLLTGHPEDKEYSDFKKLIDEKQERKEKLEGKDGEGHGEKDLTATQFIELRGKEILGLKNSVDFLLNYELDAIADVKNGGSGKFEYGSMSPTDLAKREQRLKSIKNSSLHDFVDFSKNLSFLAQFAEARHKVFDNAADKYIELDKKLSKKLYISPL